MNMNSKTTNSLRIKNIFYPPGGALTEKLYIEFQHEDEAKEVKKHVKISQNPKIMNPKSVTISQDP